MPARARKQASIIRESMLLSPSERVVKLANEVS
jgi:hypothetical protein